ncbi:DUF6916 family protein [Microbacterium fluvii]|uniref:DUF6916 family protein n=1 Tax=Microbacterium fluvii TaxID=415215 RepID=A0ABW2HCZ4_9MICO|nr:hypothetical protein [Microbacterium fluvii]MCU4672850.1 hypothetical protein [Microbacterium fluvii]
MGPIVDRRTVLGAAVGVAALGAVAVPASAAPRSARSTATPSTTGDPDLPVRSDFDGRVGERYTALSPWGTASLVLDEVADLPGAPAGSENAYSLLFSADAGDARDAIYRLTSASGAEHVLFLVRAGGASTLEATVDRTR